MYKLAITHKKSPHITSAKKVESLDEADYDFRNQDEEGINESTTESKKNTNASSSGISDNKSENQSPKDENSEQFDTK